MRVQHLSLGTLFPVEHESRAADREETLPEVFWSVARQLRRVSADWLTPWHVTPSQSRALQTLARHGAMRMTELSEHLHIAPRSATEVADDLEAKDLVQRHPDPTDRRATKVELTTSGAEIARAIRTAREAEAERVFDRLTAGEREALAQLLRKLRD
jgi:DNA-binding MarR family transcriptional regulator